MTNQQHPITPPPELVQQLYGLPQMRAIEKAYQAGADQELKVCCEWVAVESIAAATELRSARRSKPPSLKEQALKALEDDDIDVYLIRRALGALPDD